MRSYSREVEAHESNKIYTKELFCVEKSKWKWPKMNHTRTREGNDRQRKWFQLTTNFPNERLQEASLHISLKFVHMYELLNISAYHGIYLLKLNHKGNQLGALPTVGVGLCAEDLPSLGTSAFQNCSTTGGSHPSAEAMSSSQRLTRPVSLCLTKSSLPGPHNKAVAFLSSDSKIGIQIQTQRWT